MQSNCPADIVVNRRAALLSLYSLGMPAWRLLVAGETRPSIEAKPMSLEAKVAHYLEKRCSPDPRTASRRLYANLSRDELIQLLSHERPDVAMRSAWEFVRRGQGEKSLVRQFLEVARRSLDVQLPHWWEKALATAQLELADPRLLKMNTKLYPRYRHQIERWLVQGHHRLEAKGGELRLVAGKYTLPISAEVIERQESRNVCSGHCLVASVTDTEAFLITHKGVDAYAPIYRVDPESGRVIWDAEVWAGASAILGTGVTLLDAKCGPYSTTLIQDTDRIFAFGADSIHAHVEAFACNDGTSLLRFCTLV